MPREGASPPRDPDARQRLPPTQLVLRMTARPADMAAGTIDITGRALSPATV
jgi:hypothetical protein